MQKVTQTFDKQGFVTARFHWINCAGCDKEMTTRAAEGMVETHDGSYWFLCKKCAKEHVAIIDRAVARLEA
tara:strand:+ start:1388 stop:1600 length:213 start_codon:yes stop_codon:yes gene_type:complete